MNRAIGSMVFLAALAGAATGGEVDENCLRCPRNYMAMKMPTGVVSQIGFLGRCAAFFPAGDNCNIALHSVWCDPKSGQWYRSAEGIKSTYICQGNLPLFNRLKQDMMVEIDPPFSARK